MTVALLGLASFDAAAQWYVFPGRGKKAKKPVPTDVVIHATDSSAANIAGTVDMTGSEDAEQAAVIPDTVRICLSLPFESKGRMNAGMMDFYCGALLAARKSGMEGINLEIEALDCSKASRLQYASLPGSCDVIIGPISAGDIRRQISSGQQGRYVISPLDPQVSALTDSLRVIQIPSSLERQTEEMVRWLKEDLGAGDRVVVVRENGTKPGQYELNILETLEAQGITYSTVSYGILQGLQIYTEFEANLATDGHTTRYLIASDGESFTGDAVRNVAMMLHKGHQVALYGTSRTRSFSSVEAEDFHELGLKAVTAYYIDYTNPEVKNFILAYRTLFGCEPGAFAFSGYDITGYFISAVRSLGNRWTEGICGYDRFGYQADFDFEPVPGGNGIRNTAVRRIVYNPDLTISIIR